MHMWCFDYTLSHNPEFQYPNLSMYIGEETVSEDIELKQKYTSPNTYFNTSAFGLLLPYLDCTENSNQTSSNSSCSP